MNVKQGDMARLVCASLPENIGLIVSVVAYRGAQYGHPHMWECKPAWPRRVTSWEKPGIYRYSATESLVPDEWLRPIRPEADPVTTDVVAGVEA